MKALLFTTDQPNQRALANRLAASVPIAGIVNVQAPGIAARGHRKPTVRARARALATRAASATVGLPIRRAWFAMLAHYDRSHPQLPALPTLDVTDVNAPEVIALVERERPDLVIVSGTNLLKPPLIAAIAKSGRTVNLHTGISPYIKGGPNCTNWCLALRRFDLIGNSVMWLDAGIDSGNLIATERTALTGSESLAGLQIAVMDHAHDLYVRCVRLFAEGRSLPSVPQREIGEGRLFLTRDWRPSSIAAALANFHLHYAREARTGAKGKLLLVSPTEGLVSQ